MRQHKLLYCMMLAVAAVAWSTGPVLAANTKTKKPILTKSSRNAAIQAAADAIIMAPAGPVDQTKVPHYFGPFSNYANSTFTMPDATVAITGDGAGATATATVGANGAVTGFTITDPGSGYTAATVSITGAGTGATADAVITLTSAVSAITVNAGGTGYTAPVVTISGGGATTDATALAYGGVDVVTITNGGVGYTIPTVDFDMPDGANGVQAKAHVPMIANGDPVDGMDANGTITAIVVDSPGSGYSTAPQMVIRDGTIFDPVVHPDPAAFAPATATTTMTVQEVVLITFGAGYTGAPTVAIADSTGTGTGATATAVTAAGTVSAINLTAGGTGYISAGGIKKFVDGLPMLCDPTVAGSCVDNNLGQHIPLAKPDQTTFPGTDYYVIALVQHRERMSSSLPAQGTLVREYVQLATSVVPGNGVPLFNDLKDGTSVPITMPDGTPAVAVDNPHYLGPIIQATKDKPVRIVFYNLLPTGAGGDLFIPVDSTFMGAGMGPMMMTPPMDMGSVTDMVRNPMCGEATKDRMGCFAETRATLHLHGGITPWISDGSPHQWITPANEMTGWPEGVSVRQVPDMTGAALPVGGGVPECSAATDGCMTFYYTNQQSARLMFYHDHSWGITRLNVYAGEAAGYVIRDATEQKLIDGGLLPSGAAEIPLIIQDRTFVSNANQMAKQDPTWDYTRWGGEGDLWYEHVYMPAQNPGDPSGMSAYGRWMYGPWFWPPANPDYPPIANPYFNMDPKGPDGILGTVDDFTTALATPCNLDNPATWQYQTDPFCEPAQIPGTPNNSAGMEQFNDTPIVNGTAYPTLTVEPKAYRLRILNAANDRFFNLQMYIADPTSVADPAIGPTEVALDPALLAAAQIDPVVFPTPVAGSQPGKPQSTAGPDWIQIGTEGGFLPTPVVVDGQQPTTWITDPTRFDVGNVDQHSLLVAPAERADVIVDFSQFAGQTLILYNDAPAAFPARVPSYDYYTGGPDLWPAGAPTTLPGYGPNTRTVMQIKVVGTAAPAYNVTALKNAFAHKADGSGVFESGQNPIIVGQSAYNSAYATSFASSGDCTTLTVPPTIPTIKCDGYARIAQQGGNFFYFDTLKGGKIGVKIEPKAIHDEMNSTNFEPYGRMSGNLGVEVVPADPVAQNVVLYPFVNPASEMFDATNLPTTANLKPIAVATDGTQIWKFTHNGVDSHPIHFHLYDVQLINRVTWDGIIIPPDATELGWKDTVRVSPLEDTYFAIRPIIPVLPWELPNSIRPLNPMMPLGDITMFNSTDAAGSPTAPIINQLVNYGWEYMLHCHILSHEEMDMMRPVAVAVPPIAPDGITTAISGKGKNQYVTLFWNDNSINETAFVIQRDNRDGKGFINIGTVLSPLTLPDTNTHRTGLSFADTTKYTANSVYRVVAQNSIGYGGAYMSLAAQSVSTPVDFGAPPAAPGTLTAANGPNGTGNKRTIILTWSDTSNNETGFTIQRSTNPTFATGVSSTTAAANSTTLTQTGLNPSTTYYYRIQSINDSATSAWVMAAPITTNP